MLSADVTKLSMTRMRPPSGWASLPTKRDLPISTSGANVKNAPPRPFSQVLSIKTQSTISADCEKLSTSKAPPQSCAAFLMNEHPITSVKSALPVAKAPLPKIDLLSTKEHPRNDEFILMTSTAEPSWCDLLFVKMQSVTSSEDRLKKCMAPPLPKAKLFVNVDPEMMIGMLDRLSLVAKIAPPFPEMELVF